MADKPFLNKIDANDIPLESVDEPPPPPYENPQIEFNSGWRDRGFAIAFWIQAMLVIITGLVLGIGTLISLSQRNIFHMKSSTIFGFNIDLFVYSLVVAVVIGIIASLIMFFLLERCANLIIIGSFIIIIAMEISLCVFLLNTEHWTASIIPFVLLVFTLIFVGHVRKRIPFTASHLRVACAILRSHPSLILVAIVMFVVQILWLILWSLMVLGIVQLCFRPMLDHRIDQMEARSTNDTSYLINRQSSGYGRAAYSSKDEQNPYMSYIVTIITFVLLVPAYWGAIAFDNISHFITACTVGRWWFPADTAQQYVMRTSVKRAFTTSFGTICFGSLVKAILKALGSSTEDKRHQSLTAQCVSCILEILERMIGYMNEWGYIFAALTGQSFLQASRSFIQLFRTRGWTMVMNDTVVGYCLGIVNIFVGLASAVVGGLIVYFFNGNSSNEHTKGIFTFHLSTF